MHNDHLSCATNSTCATVLSAESPSVQDISPSAYLKTPWTVLETPESVMKHLIDRFDAFVFDMDGVLWCVDQPVAGAAEALNYLKSVGKRIFFVTNNSLSRRKAYAEKLERLGLGTFPDTAVFPSSRAAAECLKLTGYQGKVYMIGPPALRDELLELPGIEVIDSSIHNGLIATPRTFQEAEIDTDIGAVVMGFDIHLNYYKVAYAAALLNSNPDAHLIFTNGDHQFPTSKWILPGNGAFIATLQVATGRKGTIAGKPEPVMIEEILEQMPDVPRNRLCMVGDNLTTDIPFGKLNGLGTVLVETGVHSRAHLQRSIDTKPLDVYPDFVIPSVAYLSGQT